MKVLHAGLTLPVVLAAFAAAVLVGPACAEGQPPAAFQLVLDGDTVHLFFKGFDNNRNRDQVRVGYARAALADMKFTKRPAPILAVPGGGEMPRVFREGGVWHMFYHHFGGGGSTWRHHVSDDGLHWRLYNASFFGGHPTGGPRDIMMIYFRRSMASLYAPKRFGRGAGNLMCLHPPLQIDGKVVAYRVASPAPREVKVRVNGEVKTVTAEKGNA